MRSFSASTASTLVENHRTILFHVSSNLFVLSHTLIFLFRNLVSSFVESNSFIFCARTTTYFKQSSSMHVREMQPHMVFLLDSAHMLRFASSFLVHRSDGMESHTPACVSFPSSRTSAAPSLPSTWLDPVQSAVGFGCWIACLRTTSLSFPSLHQGHSSSLSFSPSLTKRGDPKTSPDGPCHIAIEDKCRRGRDG